MKKEFYIWSATDKGEAGEFFCEQAPHDTLQEILDDIVLSETEVSRVLKITPTGYTDVTAEFATLAANKISNGWVDENTDLPDWVEAANPKHCAGLRSEWEQEARSDSIYGTYRDQVNSQWAGSR
jgi:hypothetical protein